MPEYGYDDLVDPNVEPDVDVFVKGATLDAARREFAAGLAELVELPEFQEVARRRGWRIQYAQPARGK